MARELGPTTLTEIAAPATPGTGLVELYAKSDGLVYTKDDAGNERLLTHAVEAYAFSVTGTVAVAAGSHRIYLEGNYTFESARASVGTAPTGASLICDINKNGTTIYTTQSARPTIAVSTNTATANSPAVTTFVAGDYITVDVDQVGSTVAGSDLTVVIRLRRTA